MTEDLIDVFEDVDVSGFKKVQRPGRDELVNKLSEYSGGYLVTWKLDRLTRSVADGARIIELCKEQSVTFVSVQEKLDLSTPAGTMMAQITASFAELESANIGARVASSRKHLAQQGFFPGGRVSFGYEAVVDGAHKRLCINETEAVLVVEMAERLQTGSIRSVAIWMNEHHPDHPPRGSSTWTGAGVKALLSSRTLTGNVTYRGELVLDENGQPLQAHEAILSLTQHHAVMKRLDERAKTRSHSNTIAATSRLHGAVTCFHCGRSMTLSKKRENSYEYRCGTEGCRTRITAKALDRYAIALILFTVKEAKQITTIAMAPDVSEHRQRLADLQNSFAKGRIDLEVFEATAKLLQDQIERELAETTSEEVEQLHITERWHEMTAPEQAAEIRRLADIQVRNIDGTKKVRVTPKVEGLVDPWMYDHKLGRFQPRLFGEWITPGDYTGKYVWLRDDSELYPDDPPRTVSEKDFPVTPADASDPKA